MRKKSVKNVDRLFNISGLLFLGLVMTGFAVILVIVQASVRYSVYVGKLDLPEKIELMELKRGRVNRAKDWTDNTRIITSVDSSSNCLLVLEENDALSKEAQSTFVPILNQMKESFDICNVVDFDTEMLEQYDKLILAITHYPILEKTVYGIKNWVKNGGNLLIAYPPETSNCFGAFHDILGIKDSGAFAVVEKLNFKRNFMIGCQENDYSIMDAYDAAISMSLTDDCEVYLETSEEYPVPLIWRRNVENGSIVVCNFSIMGKAYRGIQCSAYSLLGDYCIYPVINGAAFYIDDFPGPVPEGDSTYIARDYNLSIGDFYSRVFWNDIYSLIEKYGIRATGLIIENYSNQVNGVFPRNTEVDRFRYFGNMILSSGGEIGLHGYNHMPLVLENFDYKDEYDAYIPWPSASDIRRALNEVLEFSENLFNGVEPQVYVPPSNVLSSEGRRILGETSIRTIAGLYFPGDCVIEQEFEVSEEDGIVDTPRITSGCVLDEYSKMVALSELSFHFVNTHFLHPDDVLDVDRGAALGWEKLFDNLQSYLNWLYSSVPNIRNLTGSEMAGAVYRYDMTDIERDYEDGKIKLELGNFDKEAWMLLRINNGESIENVVNGKYSEVAENLYLIECNGRQVEINTR